MKSKSSKNKLLVLSGLATITVLGSALAYFTTSSDVKNNFQTGLYQNQIIEEFESPSNWTPGTFTEKKISVSNTGSVSMAVRAKVIESWLSEDGTELSLKDSEGNIAAIISYGDGWTLDSDGYYYLGSKNNKLELKSGETSNTLLNGVTFNSNIKANLEEHVSDDGKVITYSSSGSGYDNAVYTLSVKIDTIQYDQANNVW